ncbi:MAG: O-antigen ligase family protein [Vicinamibacterales bacterium]
MTPEGLAAALALGAGFALFCFAGMSRAVWLFTALAWLPVGLIPLRGNQQVEHLLAVEVLATVLCLVWWLRRQTPAADRLLPTSFNRPLLALVVVSLISLASGMLWLDRGVPGSNVRLTVSVGQVLLIAWPIGVYFTVANTVRDELWARRIRTTFVVLALPSLLHPVMKSVLPLDWSVHIAVVAGPLCLANLLERRWTPWSFVDALVAASPIVAGMADHKAYWYIAGGTSTATILFLRWPRFTVGLASASVVALAASMVVWNDPLAPPLRALVTGEVVQQSIGGQYGRLRLATDAVRLWTGYPLFGVGPGNMWPYMHTYSVLDTTHNQYTNILLELGVAGLACVLAFIAGAFRTGLRLRRRLETPFARTLALGWIGLFAGTVVGGLTGDVMLPSIRNSGLAAFGFIYPQWVVLGLLVGLARIDGAARRVE